MAEIDNKQIEFVFTTEVLEQHGKYMLKLFKETLDAKNIHVSDDLYNSLDYSVSQNGADQSLNINFETYGRFIEIRKHKKTNVMGNSTNSQLMNSKKNSMAKKKDTDWYSKNAFGSINRLISILQNELSELEMERIKMLIQKQITT